jgi:hypothetical protein
VTAVTDRIDWLFDRIRGGDPDLNGIGEEMLELAGDREGLDYLNRRHGELREMLHDALIRKGEVMARLAAHCMLAYAPKEEQPTPNYRLARGGGPASEIALAAVWLLRYAGDVVPLDLGDGPLEEADDPDFADYQRVYASAVSGLSLAAYYLLDAVDSRPALLSSPPEMEAFPPLPFPRVWVEMSHLTPLLRFDGHEDRDGRLVDDGRDMDVLGLLVVEVEQGRVWDIYLPFQYEGEAEFYFIAGRIAPERSVALDPALELGALSFQAIRQLAVGVAHLITARNAPPDRVLLPRAQRKRLARAGYADATSLLYYVDLHAAGETDGAGAGREYTVRWLVRGHWRHVSGGRGLCTCCDPPQVASWVAPYIKGPAGAPWKGKQVHRPREART